MADNFQQVIQLAFEVLGADDAKRVADVLQGVGEAGSKADSKLAPLIDQFQQLAEKSELVSKAINLQKEADANAVAFDRAKASLAALNAEFGKSDKSSETINQAFKQAQQEVNRLGKEQLDLQRQLSTTNDTLKQSGVDVTQLGAAHDDLKTKTQESARKLTEAATAAKESGGAFDKVKEFAKGAGESLKSAGETALEFGKKLLEISGIAGVVASIFATFTGFRLLEKGVEEARSGEVAFAKLRAAVGGNVEVFEHLKEAAEQAAESVGTTSNVAVETLTKLTAQLGSADAAATALPATLTLAKAAQIDFAESADLVATTLKAFGLEADQAGQVADKLAAIAAKTGANLAELARGAAQIAPLAKDAGVGFDGVAAALAELSAKGFDAQKSNAGLRELFIALGTPTSKLRQDLVGLGVDTSSLGSILDGLRAAGDRGTDALQSLSSKGRAAISALVLGGSAELERLQKILDESGGQASKTAKLISDTLSGALSGFGRTMDNLAEDAVKGALPAVADEIRKLNDELKEVGKSDAFEKFKVSIKDSVKVAVDVFDELIHKVDWKDLGKQISDFVGSARESFASISNGVGIVSTAFGVLGSVVGAIWNTIKTVFDSIAAATSFLASHVVETMASALDKVGIFSDSAAKKAKEFHDLAKQYAENASTFWKAGDDAAEKVGKTLVDLATKIVTAGEASQGATPKHIAHTKALDEAQTAALNAARALVGLPPILDKAGESAKTAANTLPKLGDALHIVRDALGPVPKNIDAVNAAFAKLGVSSQRDLANAAQSAKNAFDLIDKSSADTAAGLADRQNAFLAYAQKALAAAASLDQGTKDSVQYSLESKAASLGVLDALRQLEGEAPRVGAAIGGAMGAASAATREAEQQAQRYDAAMKTLRDGAASLEDKMKAVAVAMESASSATERQAAASEAAETTMRSEMGAAQSLGQVMANTGAQFSAVSDAAGREFAQAMDLAARNAGLTKVATNDLTSSMNDLRNAADLGTGIVNFFNALAAAQQTQAKIDGQREGLQQQIALLGQYGTSAQQNFGIAARGANALLESLLAQRQALDDGNSGFDLLGQQELGPLQQALDAAIARTQRLVDEAAAAKQRFDDLARSTRDALLQEQGNEKALEDERHQQKLDDLKKAAELADSLNSDTYAKATEQENELHKLKMQKLAEQEAAAKKSSSSASSSSASSAASSSTSAASSPDTSRSSSGATYNNSYSMQFYGFGATNVTDFARQIKVQLDRIDARSK